MLPNHRRIRIMSLIPAVLVTLVSPSFSLAGSSDTVDLYDLSLEELLKITVVTSSRSEESARTAGSIITVISQSDIQNYGARNLIDVINRLPSTLVVSYGNFPADGLSVRGDVSRSSDHILFLIDGRPYRSTAFSTGAARQLLYNFPIENIKQIEFVRGPGSALYGPNAYTGVINIITLSPDKQSNLFEIAAGSFDTRKYKIMGNLEGEEYSGNVSLYTQASNGWDTSYVRASGVVQDYTLKHDGYSLFAQGNIGSFNTTIFKSSLEGNTYGTTFAIPAQEFEDDYTYIDTGYEYSISKKWKLNTHLSWFDIESFSLASEEWNFDLENLITIGKHSAVIGINSYMLNDVESLPGNVSSLEPWETTQHTIFGQLNFYFSQTQINVGGQWFKFKGLASDAVPRLAVIQNIEDNWVAKILYNEAYRAPNAIETSIELPTYLSGNQNLTPETVKTLEAQLIYYRPNYELSTTAYYTKQYDLIDTAANRSPPPTLTYENLNNRQFQGVEIEGRYFNKRWDLQGSVSYQENKGDEATFDMDDVGSISTMPHLLVKFGVTYLGNYWTLGIFDTYVDRYLSNDLYKLSGVKTQSNPEAIAYHNMSANWQWQLGKQLKLGTKDLKLTLYVHNLLDEEIMVNEFSTPTPPFTSINTFPVTSERAFYVSLKMPFGS